MSTGRKHKQYLARARAMGGSTTVPAERYADLIRQTHDRMSYCAMGRHLGLAHSYLRAIAVGKIKRISPENAQTILALAAHTPTDSGHVNARGTVRRLRALHALGYTWRALAAETGYSLSGLKAVAYEKWPVIEARNAEAVRVAYDRLSMRLPVGSTPHEKSAISSARNAARRKGWPPPLAWDDAAIDGPDELNYEAWSPRSRKGTTAEFDAAVVERILGGEWALTATRAERIEVVRRWNLAGGTSAALERISGWNVAADIRKSEEAA